MIVFRADGNTQIWSCHVMCCLSIAEADRDFGKNDKSPTSDTDAGSILYYIIYYLISLSP